VKLAAAFLLACLASPVMAQHLPDITEPIVPPLNDPINRAYRAINEASARIGQSDARISQTEILLNSGWSAAPATLSCNAGTLTSATGNVLSKVIGKTVFLSAQIQIATNGTCATAINVALPPELAPVAHNAFVLPGTLVGGPMTRGLVQLTPSPRINVRLFNNGYPGGSGANIVVSGVYQTQ